MIQKISDPVSVGLVYDDTSSKVFPEWIIWNKRSYKIVKVGLKHSYRQGRTLYHVFSVLSDSLFFRLVLNTETLYWKLEEISDGLPT